MRFAPGLLLATIASMLVVGGYGADAAERVERGALVMENVPDIPDAVSEAVRRYANVRGHGFAGFAENGVLVSTRFGQTSQIHHIETPLGARRQLTFYDEPVGGASPRPTGGAFAFTRDVGGDEFYQGFMFDLATGAVTQFTEDGTRNSGALWSDDGATAAWSVARDGDPDYDIVAGSPLDAASAQVALEGEGAVYPTDWSADGKQLAVQRYISSTKSRLFVLDMQSGAATEINPGADAAYDGAQLLDDGTLLTSTDAGGEFKDLVRLGPDGVVRNYTADIDWDVSGYDLAPNGRTVVFAINEDGLSAMRLLDLKSGKITDGPELPVGIVYGPRFSPDGRTVGFTFNGADSPLDAYTFDVRKKTLTRWTRAEVGGLNPDGFVAPETFRYPNADGMEIPAFVYRPEGPGPHPVVVQIHGGPEGQARPNFSSWAQYLVRELGAAVVVPNVRGSRGYGKTYIAMDNGLNRKKSVEDIGALLDWIAAQDDLDTDRVVVYGGSYGGYMVLASMIDYGDRLAGGVNIVGISDFRTFLKNTKGYRRDLRRAEYGDERDPEIAAFFEEISPLRNASKIDKPIFIIQGLNDPRVPASEAKQILAAVRENGGEAWYLLAKDEGHGFRKKSNRDFQRAAETLFLRNVLEVE
ncbi:MAG: alpha/beta fold hydrolase [Pseudomonadota bacterium]